MDLEAGKSKFMTPVSSHFFNLVFIIIIIGKFHIVHPGQIYFPVLPDLSTILENHPPPKKKKKMKSIPSSISVAHILTELGQAPSSQPLNEN